MRFNFLMNEKAHDVRFFDGNYGLLHKYQILVLLRDKTKMAIFKVLSQRNEKRKLFSNKTICSLTALPIEGELVDGMEFTAYETYHRFTVIIRSAQKTESRWLLECVADWTLYEDYFVGAVIDTSGMKRGQHFFFDHDNKYGPIVT